MSDPDILAQTTDVHHATRLLASVGDVDTAEYATDTGVCCICGATDDGVASADAISTQYFSDDDHFERPASDHVCRSCAAVMNTRTFKQGHWIAHAGGVEEPSTGDLLGVFRELRADAYDSPLAVHITSSPIRSSHAYLWTPVNQTTQPLTAAYDRQHVRIDDWDAFETLLVAIEDLRLAGFTFDEIRSGEPRVRNLRELGRDAYQTRDARIDPHRRTARLELALTLSRSADDQPRTTLDTHHPLTDDDH